MAKMGWPKVDKPINHSVTVKFKEEEYQLMVEYAERHDLSISHMLRLGIEMQLMQEKRKKKRPEK